MAIVSDRFSEVKYPELKSPSQSTPSRGRNGRQEERHKKETKLLDLQKVSDRYTAPLRRTGDPEAVALAKRMEDCASGAWVYDHPGLGPHIRLGAPCSEPTCPLCRDKRQRRAYASSLPAFERLLRQDPLLRFSLITLTALPLYGDLQAFTGRVTRFLKRMSFDGYIRGFHMTCGSEGPQAHCHVIAFYHGAPPTEAECHAVLGGRVDVKTKDRSAETAAGMFAYLFKGHQPSKGEDVSAIPQASKLLKRVRVVKSGKAIKWAFREANAIAGRLLE
jgi:hypothetical protein